MSTSVNCKDKGRCSFHSFHLSSLESSFLYQRQCYNSNADNTKNLFNCGASIRYNTRLEQLQNTAFCQSNTRNLKFFLFMWTGQCQRQNLVGSFLVEWFLKLKLPFNANATKISFSPSASLELALMLVKRTTLLPFVLRAQQWCFMIILVNFLESLLGF